MTRQIRVLVVEDEEAIRTGLIDVLVFHGYEADSAATGPEGLEKALTGKFELILLDIMLPGMDGYEICDRIRAVDRNQPIIMLTAKTSDDEIIQGLKLGADDYVAKPFSIQQLVLRIEAVLRRSQVGQEQAENQTNYGSDQRQPEYVDDAAADGLVQCLLDLRQQLLLDIRAKKILEVLPDLVHHRRPYFALQRRLIERVGHLGESGGDQTATDADAHGPPEGTGELVR